MKRRLDLAPALVHDPTCCSSTSRPPASTRPAARVWEEVRRLNADLGMTMFLTTQYLEEADELADRVGIIRNGIIVAEGTPEELKRSVGTDVIVVRIDGDVDAAARRRSTRWTASTTSTATATSSSRRRTTAPPPISPWPSPWPPPTSGSRTSPCAPPTLDDVFLELTGNRIERRRPTTATGGRPR